MQRAQLLRGIRFVAALFLAVAGAAGARAQDAASPKFTLFAGPGIVATQGATRGEIQAGASFDESLPNHWKGMSLEGGYLGPWSKPRNGSAFLSLDYLASWWFGPRGAGPTSSGTSPSDGFTSRLFPFASTGYTRLFGTGNAVNFGGGFDYRISQTRAIRVEVRDYYSFSAPAQHNVGLRVGCVIYLAD